MLAWLTHILPGELWKPVYGLCGLRCVRRFRGQVRIPCHSTRSHKRDVSPCVRWSLLRESNVVVRNRGVEPRGEGGDHPAPFAQNCRSERSRAEVSHRSSPRNERKKNAGQAIGGKHFWGIRFGDCVASGAPLCAVPLIGSIPYTPLKSHICGMST